MSKFTPGPYHAFESYTGNGKMVIYDQHGKRVAMVSDKDDLPLFLAAPLMLEALQAINESGCTMLSNKCGELLCQALDAAGGNQ
jgi:hypothetical protein